MLLCASDGVLRLPEWELQGPGQAHQSGGERRPVLQTASELCQSGDKIEYTVRFIDTELDQSSVKTVISDLSPQCDGTDLTAKVQEMKLQCLLFLNIPR